jgi:hypothetical protein
MDQPGADKTKVLDELKTRFGQTVVDMSRGFTGMTEEDKERLGIIPDHAKRGKFDASTKEEKLRRSLEKRRITKTF